MIRRPPGATTPARVRRATTVDSCTRRWMPFGTPSRSAATSALAAARCLLATRVGTCTAPARYTNTEGNPRPGEAVVQVQSGGAGGPDVRCRQGHLVAPDQCARE